MRIVRAVSAMAAMVALIGLLTGCQTSPEVSDPKPRVTVTVTATPRPTFAESPNQLDVAWVNTTVTRIVDGDTIHTRKGKVRIIGIDTPERGKCNYRTAKEYLAALIPVGAKVQLGRVFTMSDKDRYGRLVRYVDTAEGMDVGAELLKAGLAIARYDSRDGYGAHPRESAYIELAQDPDVLDCGP